MRQSQDYYIKSLGTKDQKERAALLRKAVTLDHRNPDARSALAFLLLSQDQTAEAQREYMTRLEIAPYRGREDGFNTLEFANALADRGHLDEAVQVYEKLLQVSEREGTFEQCYLFQNVDLSRLAAFKSFVTRAQRLRPYCTDLDHRNRAVRLLQQGKISEAAQELELQIKENPLYPEGYTLLEQIYLDQGRTRDAFEVMRAYFVAEKNSVERCRMLSHIPVQKFEQFDPEFLAALKKECTTVQVPKWESAQ